MRASLSLKNLLQLLLVLTSTLIFSCKESIDETAGFGNPPTPESCFCSPEGVRTYLEWIVEKYPEHSSLRTIGTSESGRAIYAIELSDQPGVTEEEPKVLINGSIHGDEQIATGVSLKLIEVLLQGQAAGDPPATHLINNFKLHFIPALNPDGLAVSKRYNDNGIDLNRNFGYTWDVDTAYNGNAAFDQAESAAVRDDFSTFGYCLALNLHTAVSQPSIGIYAPWDAIESNLSDFSATYLPNFPFIEEIGEAYASSLSATGTYPFEQYFHYQEGADWYPFCGSMGDWALAIHGTLSYSIELYGDQNFTTGDSLLLEKSWLAHKHALFDLIKTAELGTGGRVIDAAGQAVFGAEISLSDNSIAGKSFSPEPYPQLKSTSDSEGFFRLLTGGGSYSLTIEKTGHPTLTQEITVDGSGKTSKDSIVYKFFPEYPLTE